MSGQAFEAAIASLTAAREWAEKRADDALARADRAEARADQAEARAANEWSRADCLRDLLEQAAVDVQMAREEADQLRQVAADRKARGLLARLRAAWRGVLAMSLLLLVLKR